jgi:hypothetical protein
VYADISLKETLVSSLLPQVLKIHRTLRPQREGGSFYPTQEKAKTEGDVWPTVRNMGWVGRGQLAALKGKVAEKPDVRRPVRPLTTKRNRRLQFALSLQ